MITKVYQDPMKGTSRPFPVLSSQPSCITKSSSTGSPLALGPSSDKSSFAPSASNNLSDVRPKTSSGPSTSSKFNLGTASGPGLTKYTVNSATVRPKTSSGPKKPINLTISTSAANKLEMPQASSGPTFASKKPNLVISTSSVNLTRHKYALSRSTTSSPIDPIDRLKSIAATSSTFNPSTITSHNLYPYYPPTSTLAGFHTLHSRSSSASSIRSAASVSSTSSVSCASSTTSSVSSSASSVLKPNSLTKEYLFYLKSDQIADQWAGMRMLSPDEEWEEWGRGLKGVLEPRTVGMDCGWTPIGEILSH